jgi:hypothetical protein
MDQTHLILDGVPLITYIRNGFREFAPSSDVLRELYGEWSSFSNGDDFDEENILFGASIHPIIWWESIGSCEILIFCNWLEITSGKQTKWLIRMA